MTEYTPTDLSTIKKNSKIKAEKDLETEIAKLCETLKDLSKSRGLILKTHTIGRTGSNPLKIFNRS